MELFLIAVAVIATLSVIAWVNKRGKKHISFKVTKQQMVRLAAGACLYGIYVDGDSIHEDLLAQLGMAKCFSVLKETGEITQDSLHEFETLVNTEVARLEAI